MPTTQTSYCYDGARSHVYKFTGKERDSESGLDNFGARFYTSNIGRFMTPDWAARPVTVPYATFGDPQTLNLYGYVENAPLNRIDADGHAMAGPPPCKKGSQNGVQCSQPTKEDNGQANATKLLAQKPSLFQRIVNAFTFSALRTKQGNLVNQTTKDPKVGLTGNVKMFGGSVTGWTGPLG